MLEGGGRLAVSVANFAECGDAGDVNAGLEGGSSQPIVSVVNTGLDTSGDESRDLRLCILTARKAVVLVASTSKSQE